jgi:hypothetical protein
MEDLADHRWVVCVGGVDCVAAGGDVSDFIRLQCKNRGDRYTRRVADEQLTRIGLRLGTDFYPRQKGLRSAKKMRARK